MDTTSHENDRFFDFQALARLLPGYTPILRFRQYLEINDKSASGRVDATGGALGSGAKSVPKYRGSLLAQSLEICIHDPCRGPGLVHSIERGGRLKKKLGGLRLHRAV